MDGLWVPAACRSLSWPLLLTAAGVPLLCTAFLGLPSAAMVFIVTSFIGALFGVSSIVACRHAEPGVLPEGSRVVADATFGRNLHRYGAIASAALMALFVLAVTLDLMFLVVVWFVLVGVPWSLVVSSAAFGAYVERMEVRTGLRLVMQWSGVVRYLTATRSELLLVGENVVPTDSRSHL
ncbi:MAG: hypothetical protein ACT4OX_06490 [Actinomycetota bacterium]